MSDTYERFRRQFEIRKANKFTTELAGEQVYEVVIQTSTSMATAIDLTKDELAALASVISIKLREVDASEYEEPDDSNL